MEIVPERRLTPPEYPEYIPHCEWCGADVADETVYCVDSDTWVCGKCFMESVLEDYSTEEIADALGIDHQSGYLLHEGDEDY